MAKYLSRDGKFYMKDGKLLQYTVPVSKTWVINESPDVSTDMLVTINFTSNGKSFDQFQIDSVIPGIIYLKNGSGAGFQYDGASWWYGEAYRTVVFETAPTGELLTWLQANAISLPAKGKTLNEYTWSEIRLISDANLATEYGFKPGDTKSITINGTIGNTTVNQTVDAVILGINHNVEKEGNNRIHFLIGKSGDNICGMTDSQYKASITTSGWCNMNTSNTNSGGWNNSYMRKTLLGNTGTPTEPIENTFLAALPADLRAEMKSCTKYSDNTGGTSNPASAVTATTDYLFLLAEFEVFGTRSYANTAEQNSQVQYDYFKAGNSRVAGSWGSPATAVYWWLRSIRAGTSIDFCNVYTSGAASGYHADISRGVLPGFCV